MNETIISGRMTKDPNVRIDPRGKTRASFTVAVDRPFLNEEGKRDADFVKVEASGKCADIVNKFGHKAELVYVKGWLRTRNYVNKDNIEIQITELIAEKLEFPFRHTAKRDTVAEPAAQPDAQPATTMNDPAPAPETTAAEPVKEETKKPSFNIMRFLSGAADAETPF